ncbi:MAG: glycosyltransferase [Blastochloris sp.]|nr:glycosyltransferase [Blastochloris sp.]
MNDVVVPPKVEPLRVAVVMTCHNRREKTRKCLESILSQRGVDGIRLELFMTDDGSTDGTGEAVLAVWSGATILKGNGNLFWNQGMRKAWEPQRPPIRTTIGWLMMTR